MGHPLDELADAFKVLGKLAKKVEDDEDDRGLLQLLAAELGGDEEPPDPPANIRARGDNISTEAPTETADVSYEWSNNVGTPQARCAGKDSDNA